MAQPHPTAETNEAKLIVALEALHERALTSIPPEAQLEHAFSEDFFQRRILPNLGRSGPKTLPQPTHLQKFLRGLAKAAAFIVLLLSLGLLFMGPKRFVGAMEYLREVIIQRYEKFTEFSFSSETLAYPPKELIIKPNKAPSDFELLEDLSTENDALLIYKNANDKKVYYSQIPTQSLQVELNTEAVEVKHSSYRGREYSYFSRGEENFVFWYTRDYFYSINGRADLGELITMAKELIDRLP